MPRPFAVLLLVGGLVALPSTGLTQSTVLTLDAALARARGNAPQILALARAGADREADAATVDGALGDLRVLLAFPASTALDVEGSLSPRAVPPLDTLLTSAARRPDVRALVAAAAEAAADRRLGRALAWPDLTLDAEKGHEEGADILRGGIGLTIPLFDHGQGVRAEATARAERLHGEIAARRRAVDTAVRTTFTVYEARARAAGQLARSIPAIHENEELVRRSYVAGQLSLAEVLLLRREVIETRRAYIDRLEEAALAAFDLMTTAGRLP